MKKSVIWASVGALIWMGCSGKDSNLTLTTSSYQGPGSKWTASFSGSSFTITYDLNDDGDITDASEFSVTGTYQEYSNKFRKLTVSSVENAGGGPNVPSVGAQAYGIEIPGFAFFLKPLSTTSSDPIVMLYSGTCPSVGFTGNWIAAKFGTGQPLATSDIMGSATATISGATRTMAITHRRFDTGAALMSSGTVGMLSCTNGRQEFDDNMDTVGDGTMYITSSGGALVNTPGSLIFAQPAFGSSDPTATDWDGTYSGIGFSESGTDKSFPFRLTLSGTSGSGQQLTDVEMDTAGGGAATIASFAAHAGTNGLLSGTIDVGNGAQPFNCLLSKHNGVVIIGCNGADDVADGGGVYPTFFLLGRKR